MIVFVKSEKIKLINSKLVDLETLEGKEEFKNLTNYLLLKVLKEL